MQYIQVVLNVLNFHEFFEQKLTILFVRRIVF